LSIQNMDISAEIQITELGLTFSISAHFGKSVETYDIQVSFQKSD